MAGVGTVTLLFTDLVGSTALASSLGDVEVDRIRRAHFATLRAAIASTGGDEVKNLGDGLLVAYRSASDAVEGAVAMQRAVDRANADASVDLSIKIGISVGDVTEDDGDWFGMPVNEAARLCAAADGGQILASDVVRLLAGSRARHAMRPAGTRELKGLPEPLAVCVVEWTRAQESLDLPLPPGFVAGREIVGRDAELALVLDIWRAARHGTAATVLVGGEPGIGKTRLAATVAAAAHADGALVLFGRCDEDLAAPYRPWIEALRYVVLGVDPETIRDWAGVRTRELVRVVPELSARIGGLEPPSTGDPESERFALFEAVTALLTGAAAAKPLLLVLDDLQWCDTASLLLWRHVMRNAAGTRMMVVGTYRDADVEEGSTFAQVTLDLKRGGTYERVILGGLDDNSTVALLTAWAGRPIPATFARAVHEETDGNPFFVEEVLEHLVDRGSVRRADNGWEVPAALGDLAAPDGVRELVRRRATGLTEGAQRLLAVAALMGREFDLDIVADVADVKEDEVLDAFEEAAAVGLVAEIPGGAGRYRFGHALIRLALEESISAARRARLHLRIGEVLETRQPDDLTALAHHFVAATNAGLTKAVEYALGAARAALAGLAYEEAARHAEQGLRALELVDDAEPYARVDLILLLAEARTDLTEVDAAHRAAVAAADEARRLDDTPRFVRAVFLYGLSGGLDIDTVRNALVDEALDRLDEGDSSERAILTSAQAAWSMIVSPTPNDRVGAGAALDMARRVGAPRAIAYCAAVVGDLLIGSAQPRERIELLYEALAAAETSGLDARRVQQPAVEPERVLGAGRPHRLRGHHRRPRGARPRLASRERARRAPRSALHAGDARR